MLIDFSRCSAAIQACHGIRPTRVYHVGAHLGQEAGAYAANGVTDVVWFEANDDLVPQLARNLEQFPMRQRIVCCALWDADERLQLNLMNNDQCSSIYELGTHRDHYPSISVVARRAVDAYRLEGLMQRDPGELGFTDVQFLNVDTQGAELAVLRGLGEFLMQPSLKGIYLEVNRTQLYDNIPLIGEIDDFLRARGFARIVTAWTHADWGDALYLRSEEHSG